MNIINSIKTGVSSVFYRNETKVTVQSMVVGGTGSMRRPGCTNRIGDVDLSRLKSKITLDKKVFCLSGYLDPGKMQTNLRNNLKPYVTNPEAIVPLNFIWDCFRPSTLIGCALSAIQEIQESCEQGEEIILVGHSMGARISDIIILLLEHNPELNPKNIKIFRFLSVAGAHRGSPKAWLSKILCCCRRNIAKELTPERVEEFDHMFNEVEVEASYLAVKNDPIIPPEYAAPVGNVVTVLDGVYSINPHVAVLNNPSTLAWILGRLV